jgi:hypothetical protein
MFLAIGFGLLLLLIVGTVVSMVGGDDCPEFSRRFGACIPRQAGPVTGMSGEAGNARPAPDRSP